MLHPRPTNGIVIPALNEDQNLLPRLSYFPSTVSEVISVDGYSTANALNTAQQLLPTIRIVKQAGEGKDDALRTAFAACTGIVP